MPRAKDEDKRALLLKRGKKLFADPASEGRFKDLAALAEMSPSNLYTYFADKEALIGEIIEKDWKWMETELENECDWDPSPSNLSRTFGGKILAELFADAELCSLITRHPNAIRDITRKLEAFHSFLGPMGGSPGVDETGKPLEPEEEKARSAILVLGALCAISFTRYAKLEFSGKDVLQAFRSFFRPLAKGPSVEA